MVVSGLAATFIYIGLSSGGSDKLAAIGDFVGGTSTPILTALTFLGVLLGIALQRRELIATRNELELTREEAKRSAFALTSQASAIAVQNFDRSLFEQISLLNKIIDSIEIQYYHGRELKVAHGRSAFANLSQRLFRLQKAMELTSYEELRDDEELEEFFDQYIPQLSAFFRTLYNIYRFIDESDYRDRKLYNRLLRAQLPDAALPLIFYNSLTVRGIKMQRYIARYSILDNMPLDYLLSDNHQSLIANMPSKEFTLEE